MPPDPTVTSAARSEALRSPLRLEILGLFTEGRPLSVPEMAERMGRSAPSLYHHVRILAGAGLLADAGRGTGAAEGGPGPRLWDLAADARGLRLPADEAADPEILRSVMSTALRMAQRDLGALLDRPDDERAEGLETTHALRLHVRLSPGGRARVREAVRELVETLRRESRNAHPPESGETHHSLTLAFLPLPDRTP